MEKMYLYNDDLYTEQGMTKFIEENCREMLIVNFGDDLRDFLHSIPDAMWNDLKAWLLNDMSGHANWDMLGIEERKMIHIHVEGFGTSVCISGDYNPDDSEQVNDIIDQVIEQINESGLEFYLDEE